MRTTQTHVLIIVSAIAIDALLSLAAIVFLAVRHADATVIALVASRGSIGILGALLAKTERTPPTPTGTPDNPVSVQGAPPASAIPVQTEEVKL